VIPGPATENCIERKLFRKSIVPPYSKMQKVCIGEADLSGIRDGPKEGVVHISDDGGLGPKGRSDHGTTTDFFDLGENPILQLFIMDTNDIQMVPRTVSTLREDF